MPDEPKPFAERYAADEGWSFETLSVHAGQEPDELTGAVAPPIYQTSTYAQDGIGRPRDGWEYARTGNPTRRRLERAVAALEGGEEGIAFSSGAAATAMLAELALPGDEVVIGDDVYGGTYRLFERVLRPKGIIAVPNCTTLSLIVPMAALHQAFGLRELVVASYQAASGAGQAGVDSLYDQLGKVAGNRSLGQRAGDLRGVLGDFVPFPAPLVLNVVPWAGSVRDAGWSSEELKIRDESRKILGMPGLKVSATCVRVPVVTTHSVAVHAVFDREVTRQEAQRTLSDTPGVVLLDDPGRAEYPTPADVVGTDPTWVGRVRQSMDDPAALDLFICGDNLRKGAALNAAQIAELLVPELSAR